MFDSSHIHLEFAQGGHHPVSGHSFWGVFCSIARFALVWDFDATGRTFFSFHSTPQLTRLPPESLSLLIPKSDHFSLSRRYSRAASSFIIVVFFSGLLLWQSLRPCLVSLSAGPHAESELMCLLVLKISHRVSLNP